ncbi:OmpL47-type beta-barrel domain-containing protein [Bacillus horti]|nr:Ig-like domain-containing protein [Bacillus horti]
MLDGRAFVSGGGSYNFGSGYSFNIEPKLYNTLQHSWSNGAALPKIVYGNSQSVLLDGRIMIAGGSYDLYSANMPAYNDVYLYNPSTNSWSVGASMPSGAFEPAQSTLKDGRVLLTGGQDGFLLTRRALIYDPDTDGWETVRDVPYPDSDFDSLQRHSQITLPNGKVLVMSDRYFYLYDPDINTWTVTSQHTTRLTNTSLVETNGEIYVIGGYNRDTYENNRKVYKLSFDFEPPSAPTIHGAMENWVTENVQLTITPGVDHESGVAYTEYSLAGATTRDWTDYTDNEVITISNSGETTVWARTVDLSGNVSELASAVVRIDKLPPTAPVINGPSATWSSSNINVTLTGSQDFGGSGVSHMEVSFSGALALDWMTYTGQIMVPNEGITTIHARAVDRAGNVSEESSADIRIDKTAPTTPTVIPATTDWSRNDVQITITPGTDTLSGMNRTEYRLTGATGSAWTTYTAPLTISADGQTSIEARSIDNAGNTSLGASASVRIDRTAPTIPIVTHTATDWSNEDSVEVTIQGGTDTQSGVAYTEYSLSGATTLDWTIYPDSPITIENEGETTILARSVDLAGNMSSVVESVVRLDRTPPALPTISPADQEWRSEDIHVTIVAGNDSLSGIRDIEYQLSGAMTQDWAIYSSPIVISTEGQTTVSARVVDHAGNHSEIRTENFYLDKTAPEEPILIVGESDWTNANQVEVVATEGVDDRSGIDRMEYSLSGATVQDWTIYGEPIVILEEGETFIFARMVDRAGNTSEIAEASVKLDRTPPSPPQVVPATAEWVSVDSVAVSIIPGEDMGSGVALTEYRVTGATELDWDVYTGELSITEEGESLIEARSIDAVGNRSEVAQSFVRIKRTPPTIPFILQPLEDTYTNQTSVSVSGYAEPEVRIVATVNGSQADEVMSNHAGEWAITLDGLQDQSYTVSVRAIDQLGNESAESEERTFTVDTAAPEAPTILNPLDGAMIGQAQFEITGLAESSSLVTIYLNGTVTGDVYTNLQGEWSFTRSEPLADGIYTVQADSTDRAGNTSLLSAPLTWEIDTEPPWPPVILTPEEESQTTMQLPTISGIAESLATVHISINGNGAGTTQADEQGNWHFVPVSELDFGQYIVQAQAVDAVGHESEWSIERSFSVVSTNSGLRSLSIQGVPLNETVTESTYHYTAQVPFNIQIITIEVEPADQGATVALHRDGGAVSNPISLEFGEQTIEIIITAEDGVSVQVYTLAITRSVRPNPINPEYPVEPPWPSPPTQVEPNKPEDKEEESPKPPEKPDLLEIHCPAPASTQSQFADVKGHWAEQAITQVSNCGVVQGYGDGSFKPNAPVTRAQFIQMLMNALSLENSADLHKEDNGVFELNESIEERNTERNTERHTEEAGTSFVDDQNIPDWAKDAVTQAKSLGIVTGYEDGSFRPNRLVTRVEMLTMIAKAFGLESLSGNLLTDQFADATNIPSWALGYVAAASERGLVQGRDALHFVPQGNSTRAEAVVLLLRFLQK